MSTVQTDAYWEAQQDMVEAVHALAYKDICEAVELFDYLAENGWHGTDMHDNTYNTIQDVLEEAENYLEDRAIERMDV